MHRYDIFIYAFIIFADNIHSAIVYPVVICYLVMSNGLQLMKKVILLWYIYFSYLQDNWKQYELYRPELRNLKIFLLRLIADNHNNRVSNYIVDKLAESLYTVFS